MIEVERARADTEKNIKEARLPHFVAKSNNLPTGDDRSTNA